VRVLLVHNRYRPVAPSGEDRVVDQEAAELTARGHTVAMFERRSAEIATWPLRRRAALPLRVVRATEPRRALESMIISFAPDIVHVHNTFPLITAGVLLACRDAGVPVVATLHNFRLGCAPGETFRDGRVCHDCFGTFPAPALLHGCYRGSRLATLPVVAAQVINARAWHSLVSAYVINTGAQRDALAPVGLPAERCFVKPNFVPDPGGLPASPHGRRGGGKEHLLAFVGRLDTVKGVPVLLRAWDRFRLCRPGSPLELAIAGGGPMAEEVAGWAAARRGVAFLGLLPREGVHSLLSRSRAAVITTRGEETFGLVAVEAMAAGTPSVAPALGSYPELITHATDGMLVPSNDPDALADAFADIDDDPARWDAYGVRAAGTWRRRFTADRVMDRLIDIYRYALDHPAGRGEPAAPRAGRAVPSWSG
jgi:glycosyltransferase involved in cell wall biosynthesis